MRPRPEPARAIAAPLIALMLAALSTPAAGAGWQAADWRSFFHGNAAPPKSPPPAQRAAIRRADGLPANPLVEGFLTELADGLMARDAQRLVPRLSAKYAIAGLPASESARDTFVQAIERIPGPLAMTVLDLTTEKNGDRLASVEFEYPKDVKKTKRFRFDAEGKLLASDLFAIRVEQH